LLIRIGLINVAIERMEEAERMKEKSEKLEGEQ